MVGEGPFAFGFAGQQVRQPDGPRAVDVVAAQAEAAGVPVGVFAQETAAAARVDYDLRHGVVTTFARPVGEIMMRNAA